MNDEHFKKLFELSSNDVMWKGANLYRWWLSVFGDRKTILPESTVSRDELKNICKSSEYSDKEVIAAIMAWGGMRRNHGRNLVRNVENVGKVIGWLRNERLSYVEAYAHFHRFRSRGELYGMRPAYYTKLIFFCCPSHNGYIMDQWTSKSVNMIFGNGIVYLTSGYVDDRNDEKVYRKFCDAIEALSKKGNWSHEETEIRLFSHGGKNVGAWREYVKQHYVKE